MFEGSPAFVRSSKQSHLEYVVYNPYTKWAVCKCVHSQKSNICKHQLKVLHMIQLDVAEGNITRYLGSLCGIAQGGFQNLIAHANGATTYSAVAPNDDVLQTPHRPYLGECYQDSDDLMYQLVVKVVERAYQYLFIKRHLISKCQDSWFKSVGASYSEIHAKSLGIHQNQQQSMEAKT